VGQDADGRGVSEAQRRRAGRERLVVESLATGATYGAAAATAGIGRRTVARWMEDGEFRRRVSARRGEVTTEVVGRLVASSHEAIDAIRAELQNGERSGDRLRAASLLLSLGLRFREQHELEQRVQDVEDRISAAGHSDGASNHDDDDDGGNRR
jgi:hypothetical protein